MQLTVASSERTRRMVRSLAFVLASGAATIAAVGAGFAPTSAQADPGETRVPIGSGQLMQSDDLASIRLPLDVQTVTLGEDDDFSACLGDGHSWTSVLSGSPRPIRSVWSRHGRDGQLLSESIAQATDENQARQFAATLVSRAVLACQQPVGDVRYGRVITGRVGSGVASGVASWAVRYHGASTTPDGGVAVIRKGSNVGFVEFGDDVGASLQTAESMARVATDRLALSS